MQRYIIEGLLLLNFISVIVLMIRLSRHKEEPATLVKPQTDGILVQAVLEENRKLRAEMKGLSQKVEELLHSFHQEKEQWRKERLAMSASTVPTEVGQVKVNDLLLNDRYKEIFELQSQGLSAEQIAKKLEKGLGEVSLILQLANQIRP